MGNKVVMVSRPHMMTEQSQDVCSRREPHVIHAAVISMNLRWKLLTLGIHFDAEKDESRVKLRPSITGIKKNKSAALVVSNIISVWFNNMIYVHIYFICTFEQI